MYIEELLEVAIGLVFVWLGLALACMGVQEWIAALFKLRARDLEKAIRRMLEEPTQEGAKKTELVDKLYNHQLVSALSKPGRLPSYIPARTFALALFDVVMTAGTDASTIKGALETLEKQEGKLPQLADDAVKEALAELIEKAETAVQDETKLASLKEELDSLTTKYPQLKPVLDALLQSTLSEKGTETIEQIARGATRLAVSNPRAAQALYGLIAGAEAYAKEGEKALAAARTNVETWFNDTMDRLTGWYKRRSQIIGSILGVAFAIVLNVDAVAIATTLWREPTIRQALVVQAEKYKLPDETEEGDASTAIEEFGPAEAIEEFSAEFEGLQLPMGWMAAKLTSTQKCTWPWSPADKTDETVSGVPIFWECWVPLDAPEGGIPRDWGYGLSKILGLLISGLAASQGAPFWFDVLKKLTNVRFAGKNPAEEELKKKG